MVLMIRAPLVQYWEPGSIAATKGYWQSCKVKALEARGGGDDLIMTNLDTD